MTPALFEGPEKKLELAVVDGYPSLRRLGESFWNSVVVAAGARTLSSRSNDYFDAYLLSESSLFVYDNFVTMITCGQTALVNAVDRILEKVDQSAIGVCFYERKHEHFPHKQPSSFYEDARRLRRQLDGRALRFGAEHEHAVYLFHTQRAHEPDPDDVTIEVLMHGIDERRAALFRDVPSGDSLARSLGLHTLVPGADIDEYVFRPAGYSLNGMQDKSYLTLHVTPDHIGSYVSFESNVDFRDDASGLVARVVERFLPESFDVVTFVPAGQSINVTLPEYQMRAHVQELVSGYDVSFRQFFRPMSSPVRAQVFDLG